MIYAFVCTSKIRESDFNLYDFCHNIVLFLDKHGIRRIFNRN